MITAQAELLRDKLEELKPVLPIHYKELAMNQDKIPLDPNYELYLALENLDKIIYVTLRDDSKKLIGYFVGIIDQGLHYKTTTTCTMDIFYVHPDYRGNGGGFILFNEVEKEVKRRGGKQIVAGSKCHKDASFLFERLGYSKIEVYYSKYIGD
jgi:GNAT superfamily N-acetyltransferase